MKGSSLSPRFERPVAPRPVRWALFALLLVSFAIRAWSGSARLDSNRHHDERYTLRNVKGLLAGRLEPVNAYYPSLSYVPVAALFKVSEVTAKATGWKVLEVRSDGPDGLTPTAYLLGRWLSAFYGTLSLWLLYRLGARLYSPGVGLAAAALLSVLPAHVTASTLIKPDILVVALTLLATDLAVSAVVQPSWRRYALTGVAIGACVAAKYTGVGAALPLAALTLWGGWRDRRAWGRLVLAGAVSVLTFAALNPFFAATLSYVPVLLEIYDRKGAEEGGGHLGVLRLEAAYVVRHHGAVIAALAFSGIAWLAVRALRFGNEREGLAARVTVAHPLLYSALYAGATTLFKGQNYLAVVAFTSLAAAWLLGRAAAMLPAAVRRPGLVSAVSIAAFLWLARPAISLAHQETTPSTYERAATVLTSELAPVRWRHVVFERRAERMSVVQDFYRAGTSPLERLDQLSERALDRTDAEVFEASQLEGDGLYARRRQHAALVGREVLVPSRWFHSRGEDLLVLLHPWTAPGEPRPVGLQALGGNRFAVQGSLGSAGEIVSLAIEVPAHRDAVQDLAVAVRGERLALLFTHGSDRKGRYLTPRFEVPSAAEPTVLTFENAPPMASPPEMEVQAWRAPPE